jgi:hypothetical protein
LSTSAASTPVAFAGPAGRIEGVLEMPDESPCAAAVVCHPHPLHGGTLQNTIVVRAARALRSAGLATLRMNFRGVGGSAGTHDGRGAEEGDAAAGLGFLAERLGPLPLWAAGYSFGARTVCGLANRDARIVRVVLVALPVAAYSCGCIETLPQPGFLLFGGGDPFGTLTELAQRHGNLPERLEMDEIPGADHFFKGCTPILEQRIGEYARRAMQEAR